jgi:hypothetical protein
MEDCRGEQFAPSPQSPSPKALALAASGQHGEGMPSAGTFHANGGAPLLDHWTPLAARIDRALADTVARVLAGENVQADLFGGEEKVGRKKLNKETAGAKLLRDAVTAGEIDSGDTWWIPTQPFRGAHYATFPEELPSRLIRLMCPFEVCRVCGEPRRRIVGEATYVGENGRAPKILNAPNNHGRSVAGEHKGDNSGITRQAPTLGWSSCSCADYRPGLVLDPFSGSGTTLAVAQALGRDAIGIDLDPSNAHLARERVGLFLEVVA